LYLLSNPSIFDVLRVKVATLVQPGSPVFVHLGGEVSFKIVKNGPASVVRDGITWTSSHPSVLEIDSF
jgi:hypothetical protein